MLIDYKDFIVGAMSVVLAYAFFKDNPLWDVEQDEHEDGTEILDYTIEDHEKRRLVPLACQTCRKLKKHREIELDLYQCTKCKRKVDLRRKSS
ncbi:hypothetical protein [Schinkia azotoformans]|uniref:hypothetical protein n=1 Tax=Schinkia azotoformans TaxID=1454 RepID=UPI002DBA596E|nr:hypothetical protein [Schinkia azotoformans]MEC1716576.1 hypothetical protein [Schinkia azotoformans]MEC1739414.1 hypothetical protein [Schinkia azotoformans]MEC1745516.1 hypothetical protein [Schinkia azotoformans]MEC1756579.1 hypothetical protein [Schinkia azotoformans]MEC1765846.1 hypothetical protein [Schinkia azotoformans]